MYVLGENPFLSDPDTNKVRRGLSRLEFLVVQDIFLTETCEFADVILPASSALEKTGTYTNTDRRVQVGRPALRMPGEARLDWEIVCEISTRMGYPMPYRDVEEVFLELASLGESLNGLTFERLSSTGKLYPCPDPENTDGTVVMYGDAFPTPSGRGKFVPADVAPPHELPDDEYPFVLATGRLLEHWHTGSMTRRAKVLDALEPEAFVEMHPEDAARMGLAEGDRVRVASRRGEVVLRLRLGDAVLPGNLFLAFHFREAGANLLTSDALDPMGKIPEFKVNAVRVEKVAPDGASGTR
jgi:formate dehydrogenase major subunit